MTNYHEAIILKDEEEEGDAKKMGNLIVIVFYVFKKYGEYEAKIFAKN